MKIQRVFTVPGADPFDVPVKRVRISIPSGPLEEIEVPEFWSQNAADILGSKYARKGDVPGTGHETSFKQIFGRLVNTWTRRGQELGYFDTEEDAAAFRDECAYMLVHQIMSPNSPQYFNVGLWDEYGIMGEKDGHWYIDPKTGEAKESPGAYVYPQCAACFILEVADTLLGENGIVELMQNETRIFKFGSGSGVNLSSLRSRYEPLSGGGTSSGLLSFAKVLDANAGAIKSGGRTRRAATDRTINLDHPEALDFIWWKAREEDKALALIRAGYDGSIDGEAYSTVSGQNCNTNVTVTDEFLRMAFSGEGDWEFKAVTTGEVVGKMRARDLLLEIAKAAHRAADPGLKYIDTINRWNPLIADGQIIASNPCNEYLSLTNTACVLGSVRLTAFYDPERHFFDVDKLVHALTLLAIVLDISVSIGGYPFKKMAEGVAKYRNIGLGAADLGALLMRMGIPYDSAAGRAWGQVLSAIITGVGYRTSALLAKELGPFPRFEHNKAAMLSKIERMASNAFDAYYNCGQYFGNDPIYLLDWSHVPDNVGYTAWKIWEEASKLASKYGVRNAEVSAWAPTGTISFVMDCDTTSLEPDFSPVKLKKLAGGGYMRILNRSMEIGLRALGYTADQRKEIMHYVLGHQTLKGAPHVNDASLRALGASEEELEKLESLLPMAFSLRDVITPENLPSVARRHPGVSDILSAFFTPDQIEAAERYVVGHGTIEGAPHLKPEHLPVFDCAVPSRPGGRFLSADAHVKMLAACQAFTSMGISKTVNMPRSATVEDLLRIYELAWKLGVKCISIYRDGSKHAQPLSTGSSSSSDNESAAQEAKPAADTAAKEIPVLLDGNEFGEIDLTDPEFLQSGLKCTSGSCSI